MYLSGPALPVNFSIEQAVEMIESRVRGKYWHDFEVGQLKLVYIPFWVFSYDTFAESAAEGSPKVVSDASSGTGALNAFTNELSEDVASLYDSAEAELQNTAATDYPHEVQRMKVRESAAERLIPLRLAARLGVPKDNVVMSGLELVYVPMWFAWLTVAEGTFKMDINAYSGEMLNAEQVPERERGWLELTQETLEELKQPDAWMRYTQDIGYSAWGWFTQNRQLQIVVLAIIAVLVALWTIGYL